MATTQTITSTYAGKDAGIYIGAAIKTADTIAKGAITVLPNVKYKTSLHKLTLADGTANFACDFTPAGSVTLADVTLVPKKLMLNLELCKENFVDTWEAESMGFGAVNENLPANFTDYFVGKVLEAQAAKIDKDIWQGNATASGEFDGIIMQMTASGSGVTHVSGTTVTASNVVAEMAKVYDAISDAVLSKEDLVFAVSADVARKYARALSALGYRTDYYSGEKPMDFEGKQLTVINGLPTNTMVAYQKSNMYFATGLLNEANEVSILDMKDHDLSDNVRFKLVYSAGVKYVVPGDIVHYSIT